MENTPFTRTIYHAHIDVQTVISAIDATVINSDQPKAAGKPVVSIPVV